MDNASKLSINSETNWPNPFGIALVVYYLVMAVVGMCIPDDILQTHAGARQFSDFMASIVPQIDRLTAINIKPEVNRFYFSVLWAGSPVLFSIVCAIMLDAKRRGTASLWIAPLRDTVKPVLFATVICCLALFPDWLISPSLRVSRFTFSNAVGRGLVAQLFEVAPVLFAPGICVWILAALSHMQKRLFAKAAR